MEYLWAKLLQVELLCQSTYFKFLIDFTTFCPKSRQMIITEKKKNVLEI